MADIAVAQHGSMGDVVLLQHQLRLFHSLSLEIRVNAIVEQLPEDLYQLELIQSNAASNICDARWCAQVRQQIIFPFHQLYTFSGANLNLCRDQSLTSFVHSRYQSIELKHCSYSFLKTYL